MDVFTAYKKIKGLGFVSNHIAFSLDYLNKHPGYFDDLIYTGREPSMSALVSLYVRVNAIIDFLQGSLDASACQTSLRFLARDLWGTIVQRCCSLLPPNRLRPAQTRQSGHSVGPYRLSPQFRKQLHPSPGAT